ncbi:DNA primase DnaG [Candidatus Bathyarchaeota archaeon]|nr:DNA primase DnaG [Candidatus Bathyarchaeota archaeon]
MAESSQYTPTTKYVVKARFEVEGVVEKPDVIGAIFGQTEGLFGTDLDLRELQKGGRVGRLEIELESKQDRTSGIITIPSSLDRASTALIAAAIESVDRIGPCDAKVVLETVQDVRDEKRKVIMNKAKEILRKWVVEDQPSTDEIVKEVAQSIRSAEVVNYGPENLPAGPEMETSGSIVLVEGRADVINLLRCGIKNAIGINGAKIPQSIIQLCKNKEVTAFLDGDRGGELILKELMQVADLDYVAQAPSGKEVEDLTPKEIMKALRDKLPPSKVSVERRVVRPPMELPEKISEAAAQLRGSLEAILFNESGTDLMRIPVSELAEKLPETQGIHTLVFDGVITQRILDMADQKGVKYIVGDRVAEGVRPPMNVKLMTISDLLSGR